MAMRGRIHRFGNETGVCSEREETGVVDTAAILAVRAADAGLTLGRERPEVERDDVDSRQPYTHRAISP